MFYDYKNDAEKLGEDKENIEEELFENIEDALLMYEPYIGF